MREMRRFRTSCTSGSWGGDVGVNVVRLCEPVFRNLSIHNMFGLWKNGHIHILGCPKCWLIHVLPFDILYQFIQNLLFAVCIHVYKLKKEMYFKLLTLFIYHLHWHPFTLSNSAVKPFYSEWTHLSIPPGRVHSLKRGPFMYQSRKIGSVIYFFFWIKGANHIFMYLTVLKKGAIRYTHRYYATYRKLSPSSPPPPRPPPHPQKKNTHTHESCACAKYIILAYALYSYILLYPMILLVDSGDPDQTARMHRLIWAFAVRICPKTRFRITRPARILLWYRYKYKQNM